MKSADGKKEAKRSVSETIAYMRDELGVQFERVSEETAAEFLSKSNYFFRVQAYCANFQKNTKTKKYARLDFAHLMELSTIDMYLRKLLLKLTLDLEHYLKVKLVNDCQQNERDDGCEVLRQFFERNPKIKEAAFPKYRAQGYGAELFAEVGKNPAVWNIVDVLGFFDFTLFFEFYYDYFKLECRQMSHLSSVRRIRNAAAHNNCMIHNLAPAPQLKYDVETMFALSQSGCGLTPTQVSACMKVPVLNDFAVMLGVYAETVSSERIKEATFAELREFFDGRMLRHKDYFAGVSRISEAYKFARHVVALYGGEGKG